MNLNAKYDVFVSYSRKDYVDASGHPIDGSPISKLLRFLDDNKITYWIDKEGIYSGSEFVEVITDAITESKMLIFVSSQHSNASKYTTGEIFEALDQDKLIVPFKIDDSLYNKKYRMMVRPLDFIEYYSNPQLAFESLLKTINTCKKEYEELLLEEQRKKAEADTKRRITELENEIKNEMGEYHRYASNLDIKAHQIVEKQKQIGNIQKKCPICTTLLPVESKYCSKCGWSFNPVFDVCSNGDKDHIFLMQSNWKSLKDSDQIKVKLNDTIAGLESAIDEKNTTINTLRTKLSQIQDIAKNLETIKSERNELRKNQYDLQQKLKKAESETQDILEQSITAEERLKSKIKEISQQLTITNNELSNKEREIATLETTLSNIKTILSNTQQKLQVYQDTEAKQKAAEAERQKAEEEKKRCLLFKVGNVDFKMIHVESGTFQMGATLERGSDAYDNEKPAHRVTISKDYYIGETLVTQALWKAVMGSNPSYFKGNSLPVEQVSWNDCQEFIRKLNAKTGKKFRLPTEAEWEFAACGGIKSKHTQYSGSENVDEVAWYDKNSGSKTHPVKTKSPNELGIYDMSGNVWEWCQDWYERYSSNSQTNSTGLTSGFYRVYRGGSWSSNARNCRLSNRHGITSSRTGNRLGFRLALSE